MSKKKKTSLVKPEAKKPKVINIGLDFAEASIDRTRRRGERRHASIHLVSNCPKELRKFGEFCIQAAEWMDDEK